MRPSVDTKDPTAVEREVQETYGRMFSGADRLFVPRVFGWALECFTGHFHDYQAIDALYHDAEHTMQGVVCLVRMLEGRWRAGAEPSLDERMFQLVLVAMLLHDTGYLKEENDTQGTGAKYTVTHVDRSALFAARLLKEKGYSARDISAVQNMIRCTGVNVRLDSIPFQGETERLAGFALASADLLGQMAADDYVDKLPVLYAEFAEAAEFTHDQGHFVSSFSSAEELVRKTPVFWEKVVLARLRADFQGLYRFLNAPYPDGPNEYVDRINANMERLGSRSAGRV
jgi:hypothetical protein